MKAQAELVVSRCQIYLASSHIAGAGFVVERVVPNPELKAHYLVAKRVSQAKQIIVLAFSLLGLLP